MEVILNQPVYQTAQNAIDNYNVGFFKGVTSFVADLVGYNLFRIKENYLFPSDHFGLLASFKITKN
jgi:hypothetical protein